MQWNDGYIFDIPYPGAVYKDQMPSHLDAVCLVSGIEPAVDPGVAFNYCELGCGVGDTAMVVAAACPQARVWGFDFNPGHIAQGNASAVRAGLDNLVLAERSFEDLAGVGATEVPLFDYVTLHGVWSWVSPANRAHIVSFLKQRLRPGGIFSVSYNAMPGWSGAVAMQHLLLAFGRQVPGGSDARVREAIASARRMVDVGASALDPDRVAQLERMLAEGHSRYLSHEYLNEHWVPVFHADVVAALAPAKLSYVGSANILENFNQLCVKPEHGAFLETLPASLQQTVLDFFCPRTFRRDVFVRGARTMPARERMRRLESQRLALVIPPGSTTCRIKIPIGEATLNEAFYGPALTAIGRGNASVRDLLDAATPGTAPKPEEIVGILVGSGQVLPVCAAPDAASLARARRFNRERIATSIDEGQQACWLTSPLVGSSIRVGLMEMLIYEVVTRETDPAAMSLAAIRSGVLALLKDYGMSIDDKPSDGAASGDSLDEEIESFAADKLAMWLRLGVL